jgi:hypothetical protein
MKIGASWRGQRRRVGDILSGVEVTVMKIFCFSLLAAALLTGMSVAQAAAQPAGQAPSTSTPPAPASAESQTPPLTMQFTAGTVVRVTIDKTIDAKKAQVGEEVTAKTMDDLKSVPPGLANKGCEVVGHITQVAAHDKDAPSTMTIVFDKMILKNGSAMPLPAIIQAVGYADQFNPADGSEIINSMGGGTGGSGATAPGGYGTSPIGAGGGDPSKYGGGRLPSAGGSNPDAKLPYNAKGPIGMSGVSLSAGTAHDSILTAKKKNVKLESSMQMILRTE